MKSLVYSPDQAIFLKPDPEDATPKRLDGEQEAQVIAMRLGPPPKGYANWSLRLLARRVVVELACNSKTW
jgi:hypothetical protein